MEKVKTYFFKTWLEPLCSKTIYDVYSIIKNLSLLVLFFSIFSISFKSVSNTPYFPLKIWKNLTEYMYKSNKKDRNE